MKKKTSPKSKLVTIKATDPNLRLAQLAALKKRLQSGKPLTAAQMAFVERDNRTDEPPAPWPQVGDIAASVNELANRLGVDRRVIGWHRGRDGAPTTLSASLWRSFLDEHGKSKTVDRMDKRRRSDRDTRQEIVEDAMLVQFHRVSNALPIALRAALESESVKLPEGNLNRVTFKVWLALAGEQQACAELQGVCGVLDPDEDGCDYPHQIQKLAALVS